METPDDIGLQRVAKAIGYLFLLVFATATAVNFVHPFDTDFISYWSAGRLAAHGNPSGAYDIAVQRAVQAQAAAFKGLMPFPYPPALLILLMPFGLLPYAAGAALWVAATFAGYAAAARRLMPGAGWLIVAFPPVLVNAIIGQNAFLTAGLFMAGLWLLPKRPFLAGLLLGCLVLKPHLGLLLPIAFVAARQKRAFAGAAVSAAGIILLGLAAFGPDAYRAWIGQAPLYASILSEGLVGWHKTASVYGSLRLAGLPSDMAWAAHGSVALAAALAVWRVWRGDNSWTAKSAFLAAATLLVSPYLYAYDTVLLVMPFCCLLATGRHRPLLALSWCAMLANVGQNWGFNGTINLNPLITLALLGLLWRETFEGAPAAPARPAAA